MINPGRSTLKPLTSSLPPRPGDARHYWRVRRIKRSRMARLASLLGGAAAVALGMAITPLSAAGAPAVHWPAGFWNGSDIGTVKITGHMPYKVAVIGRTYGGYIG